MKTISTNRSTNPNREICGGSAVTNSDHPRCLEFRGGLAAVTADATSSAERAVRVHVFFFAVLIAQINDSELQLEQRYRNMLSESVMNEDRDAQESVLRSLVGLNPQDFSLQVQLIDVLRSNGHVSEATKLLQPLLLTDSESGSEAHLLYAKYLIAEETAAAREQAIQQLVLADEKNPNNPAVLRLLARTLVKQGAITLGLKRFKQLAEADPIIGGLEYIKFLNLTGDLPSAQNTIDKAERELKLKTDTDTPAELDVLQLAQLYLLTNRTGEALTLLEDVLPRLNSRDVQNAYSEALVESARISLKQAESPLTQLSKKSTLR